MSTKYATPEERAMARAAKRRTEEAREAPAKLAAARAADPTLKKRVAKMRAARRLNRPVA